MSVQSSPLLALGCVAVLPQSVKILLKNKCILVQCSTLLQATITSKLSSWTNITKLIKDDNSPVFNQTLQIQVSFHYLTKSRFSLIPLVSTTRKSSLPKVDRDEVLQSSLENVQPMLNLAVLDKDFTDDERKIAEVQLPLADSEGHSVTRKLDITFCGNFFTCKLG